MHFSAASLVALVATASAVAIKPRADYGYWDFSGSVSYPSSGYTSYKVDATYHNSDNSSTVDVTCSYLYSPATQSATASCSDASFTYDLGGPSMFFECGGKVFQVPSCVG